MLEDIDLTKLEVKSFSGADIGPKYELQHPAPHPAAEADQQETDLQKYEGNCHCGQYKFSINVPEIKKVRTCNCSICTRVCYLFINPQAGILKVTEWLHVALARQR
jgi:hypothetical protein